MAVIPPVTNPISSVSAPSPIKSAATFAPTAYGLAKPANYANSAPSFDVAAHMQQIAQAAQQAAQARQSSMMGFDQTLAANAPSGSVTGGYSGSDIAHAGDMAAENVTNAGTSESEHIAQNLLAGQQMSNEAAAQHNMNQYQQQQNAIQQELVPEHAGEYLGMANYYKAMAGVKKAAVPLTAAQTAGANAAAALNRAKVSMLSGGLPTAPAGG